MSLPISTQLEAPGASSPPSMSLPRNATDAEQPFTNSGVSFVGDAPPVLDDPPLVLAPPVPTTLPPVPVALPLPPTAATPPAAPPPLPPPIALVAGVSLEPQPTTSSVSASKPNQRRHDAIDGTMTLHGGRGVPAATSAKRSESSLCC